MSIKAKKKFSKLPDEALKIKIVPFKFQPPRIGGVKVYDRNVSRNEILMDLDFFYAGDCDISFTLGGISGGLSGLVNKKKIEN